MTFDEWLELAREYKEQYGNLLVPSSYVAPTGEKLGNWIANCRAAFKHGKLPLEKIEALNKIGMTWQIVERNDWQDMFAVASLYKEEYGNLLVRFKYVTPDGKPLGHWIKNQRAYYCSKKTITKDRIEKLEAIGMLWKVKKSYSWHHMYKLAEDYFKKHGNLKIHTNYVAENGEPLGRWIATKRCEYLAGTLSKEKQEKLECIGMVWKVIGRDWNEKFAKARAYYTKHGHLLTIKINLSKEDENLLSWLREQRYRYKKGELSEEKIKKLESIGMIWQQEKEISWDGMHNLAKEYFKKHGNLDIPQNYVTPNNERLGFWLENQHQLYKFNKLSKEKQEKLESIGIAWQEKICSNWDEMYELAKNYYLKYGDLKIARNYITKNGENLDKWIMSNRHAYLSGNLSPERIQKLEAIGMIWHVKTASYDIDIYLKELPVTIDKEINKNVLKYISLMELQTKIRFLCDIGESPVDGNGRLIDIFTMSNQDIEEKYGVNIESLIKYYKKDNTRKLNIKL